MSNWAWMQLSNEHSLPLTRKEPHFLMEAGYVADIWGSIAHARPFLTLPNSGLPCIYSALCMAIRASQKHVKETGMDQNDNWTQGKVPQVLCEVLSWADGSCIVYTSETWAYVLIYTSASWVITRENQMGTKISLVPHLPLGKKTPMN